MTFDVKAQLLLDNANWEAKLTKASKQMTGFGKSMKTISNGVKAAWAGVALIGIGSLYDGIVDVTKAATEDKRSMALLNEQMRRTWHGNDELNKSIDDQINTMSNATGIIDDKLRPALIRIAAVTKSPRKGMKYLALATDIAAKSGKDLNMVSMNFAKFLGGNKTALDKLVPGLAKSGDRMKFLKDNYAGFAVIAGQNDPFSRINVVIENFKEKLGLAFLPMVNNIADWLAGPEAQAAMDDFAKRIQDAFSWFSSPEGKQTISDWYEKIKELIVKAVALMDKLFEFANSPTMKFIAGPDTAKIDAQIKAQNPEHVPNWMKWFGIDKPQTEVVPPTSTMSQPIINNNYYTINGVVSGNDVVKALRGQATQKGQTILKLLGN